MNKLYNPPGKTNLLSSPLNYDNSCAHQDTEKQIFVNWLRGAYLTIPLHVDTQMLAYTFLHRHIYSLLKGSDLLINSKHTAIASAAKDVFTGVSLFGIYPKINSRALFRLAVRLNLDPSDKQLLYWVDFAYGDNPQTYHESLFVFGIMADGSLYDYRYVGLGPVISETQNNTNFQELPAFWKIIHILTKSVLKYTKLPPVDVAKYLLDIIANLALPIDTASGTLLYSNYVAILQNRQLLFGAPRSERVGMRSTQFLQTLEGCIVRGDRMAEVWLCELLGGCRAITESADSKIVAFKPFLKRYLNIAIAPVVMASLEELSSDAQPDANATDSAESHEPNNDKNNTDKTSDTSSIPLPKTNTDVAVNNELQPDESSQNNSIGDISLEQDDDPGRAYLYRLAVLSLDGVLTKDPNIDVSQTVRQTLHQWCSDWMWLASVNQTEALIKDLGLQKMLRPIAKKD